MKRLIALFVLVVAILAPTAAQAHPGKPWVNPALGERYVKSQYDVTGVKCFGLGPSKRWNGLKWYAHLKCVSYDSSNVYCFVFHPLSVSTFKVVYFRCPSGTNA